MKKWAYAFQIAERVAATLCLLAVAWSAGYAAYDLHLTQVEARASFQGLTSALDSVVRPCGSGAPCGLLAETNKMLVKLQDISVTLQGQVSQSSKLVDASALAIQSAAGDVRSATQHIGTLADAGTQTLNSARTGVDTLTVDLRGLQTSIDASAGLLNAGTATVRTFQGRLSDPRVDALLDSAKGTGKSTEGIAANLNASTLDFQTRFHTLLYPPKCKTFGCKFSRHIWPAIRGGGELGVTAFELGNLFGRAIPVRVTP